MHVHEELFVVASADEQLTTGAARRRGAIPEGLSPAVVSRLTLVHVEPPTYDDFEVEYSGLLTHRIGGRIGQGSVEYMFTVLRTLAQVQPRLVQRLTLRRLLQWCDYAQLDRWATAASAGSTDTFLANLVLGAQVLLLDQLDKRQRAIAIDALRAVEAKYTALAPEQHADPDRAHGHYDRSHWVRGEGSSTYLSYLGLRVGCAVHDIGSFEPSFSAVRNLSRVLIARDTGHTVNLVGPPGIGKSAVTEVAAKLLRRPFTRISCSRSLTVDDLFGSYRPTLDRASGQIIFLFRRGPLAEAIACEGLVLLDEINLAPADVLGVLCGLLGTAPGDAFETRNQSLRRRGTIFVAAMNDVSVGGGRQELPRRLDDLMTRVQLVPFEADEVSRIAHGVCGAAFAHAEDASVSRLLDVALELNRCLPESVPGVDVAFNLRTVQNAAAVFEGIDWESLDPNAQLEYRRVPSVSSRSGTYSVERGSRPQREYLQLTTLMLVYTAGCHPRFTAAAEEVVARLYLQHRRKLRALCGDDQSATEHESVLLASWRQRRMPVCLENGGVRFGPAPGVLAGGVTWSLARYQCCDDYWADTKPALQRGARHQRMLEFLALASESRRIVMLEGPACSGKTAAVRDLAWLRNARLLTLAINAETETTDLIGGFAPTGDGPGEEALRVLNAALSASLCSASGDEIIREMISAHVAPLQVRRGSTEARTDKALVNAVICCVERLAESSRGGEATVHTQLAGLLRDAQNLQSPGEARLPFRIYEGPLVIAMRRGYWLLMDNINAASPEVVERINSLGEADASMHLFELGGGKLKPHAHFRCFATAATKRGSAFTLSEAFRNRCLIIQCEPLDAGLRARPSFRQPGDNARAEAYEALELLACRCGCSPRMAHELVRLHEMALEQSTTTPRKVCGYEVTVRNLHKAALMAARGAPMEAVLRQSYDTMAPLLSQGLWDKLLNEAASKLEGDVEGQRPNAARETEDSTADAPERSRTRGDDDEEQRHGHSNSERLRESADGKIDGEESADGGDGEDRQAPTAGSEELGDQTQEHTGDQQAEDDDENATDGGSDVGGDDEVVDAASQVTSAAGSGLSNALSRETATGAAGGLSAERSGGSDCSIKERVRTSTQSAGLEEAVDGNGDTATVSIETEGGNEAQVCDEMTGREEKSQDGVEHKAEGHSTALGAASTTGGAPSSQSEVAGPSSPLLGRYDPMRGDAVAADAPHLMSDALMELVDSLVARLAQQVLTPALEGTEFSRLQAMAAEIAQVRQEHEIEITLLRSRVMDDVHARQSSSSRQLRAAETMRQASSQSHLRRPADRTPTDAHAADHAVMDALLHAQESETAMHKMQNQLGQQINELRGAYAASSRRAISAFELVVDAFETETAASLERVAQGTSLGITLDMRASIEVRAAAIGVGNARLATVLEDLRLKLRAGSSEGDDGHSNEPPDGVELNNDAGSSEDEHRNEKHKDAQQAKAKNPDVSKQPNSTDFTGSGATDADDNVPLDSSQQSTDTLPQPDGTERDKVRTEGAITDADTSGGICPAGAAAPSTAESEEQIVTLMSKAQTTAQTLAAWLVAQRATKPVIVETADEATTCRTVQAVICIDAAVVAENGHVLPPLLCVLMEALQSCNFEVEVTLSGPREMTLPSCVKSLTSVSARCLRLAAQRVLHTVAAPSWSPRTSPPDLMLAILPKTTEKGVALPLAATSSAARAALLGAKLGYVHLAPNGALEMGRWSLEKGADKTNTCASIEELLGGLQPPRKTPSLKEAQLGVDWLDQWKRWSSFDAPAEESIAALRMIQQQMRTRSPDMAVVADSGAVIDSIVGQDLRGQSHGDDDNATGLLELLPPGEFRTELQARQQMRSGSCLLTECEALWQALESAELVQQLTEELTHALCSMPPNVYTQCSVSTQGKILSIPALVKRYILGNSVTAIWKRQDRGGKRRLAVCLVLDLTPASMPDSELTAGVLALLAALLRMQYLVQLVAFTHEGAWVLHVGGEAWESASKARLLSLLGAAAAGLGTASTPSDSGSSVTAAPRCCHVRQATLLGLQMLHAAPLAASSPKMLWLISSGTAECSSLSLRRLCAQVEARNVQMIAISLRSRALSSLGCPRWLCCSGVAALPKLITAIFADERPREPTEPSVIGAIPAVQALATPDVKEMRCTGVDAQAAMAANSAANEFGKNPPAPHVYLSGALDYATSAPPDDAKDESKQSSPPPEGSLDVDGEIEAFFRKVRSSWKQVRTSVKLTWSKRGITSYDAAIMARIFSLESRDASAWNLRHLSLENNQLGDSGLATFSWALSRGALGSLTRLTLTWNAISTNGMVALCTALRAGAVPHLEWLFLNGNRIDDDGVRHLASVVGADGVLANLQQLWLHENEIGDAGILALCEKLIPTTHSPLSKLGTLSLDHNRMRRSGVAALTGAISAGALPRCKNIIVSDNPAGPTAQQEVTNILQKRPKQT